MLKKKLVKILVFACVIALSFGVFAACTGEVDAEVLNNISELTVNVYTAKTEKVEITLVTGERETPYCVNGESGPRAAYTIITVRPFEMADDPVPYDYVIKAGKNEYRGRLNLHPFGVSYTDTVNKKAEGAVSVSLTGGGYSEEVALSPQFTDKMINWEDALKTGISSVKNEVQSLYSGKKLMGEVYVRFTNDPLNANSEYFWYVAVVGNNGKTYGALINPLSGEVIATKKI